MAEISRKIFTFLYLAIALSSQEKDAAFRFTFGKPRKYVKGVSGTFDENVFKDHQSGQFSFPDYNTHWKGIVRFKDITKYKKDFAERLSKKQIANLSLDNLNTTLFRRNLRLNQMTRKRMNGILMRRMRMMTTMNRLIWNYHLLIFLSNISSGRMISISCEAPSFNQ